MCVCLSVLCAHPESG
uniref:Uncharacterized protein n=1 Tax=Anguilla anguilla TaxID=7936 RepID=A0A0E9QT29_ANGAN